MYEKIILILFCICFFFIGCKSTKLLPGDGTGVTEYRELQSDVRDGETELAISITEVENTSEQIRESVTDIRDTSDRIEQTIKESENSEQEFGRVIQRIRERKIERDKLIKLGIEFSE